MNYRQKLNSLGLEVPSVLLPRASDLSGWPVIACDQFTQDRGYWEKVKDAVRGSPSTLNLIFPEVYLGDGGAAERIAAIHSDMKRYLRDGVFAQPRDGFIYIERDTPYQKKRRGLISLIDLEQYDWKPGSRPLIRSTEGTLPERLPARMDIRRGASLELPHVLLLIDDDKDELLPALGARARKNAPLYDTPLMMDSGSVTGWLLDADIAGSDVLPLITEKLNELYLRSAERYNFSSGDNSGGGAPFLFAAGDGNHSLAAVKEIWNEIKEKTGRGETGNALSGARPFHPARHALVEIENIYDPAVQFEPIHRIIFNIEFDEAVSLLSKLPDFTARVINSARELSAAVSAPAVNEKNRFGVVSRGRYALIGTSASGIACACLQPLLDDYSARRQSHEMIDYIHDEKELFRLTADENRAACGILLPPVQKSGLFETVARSGPLPRKSFSMGHSREKRFYLEARSLL